MKVVLILMVMTLANEPYSINIDQPSVEKCLEQAKSKLADMYLFIGETSYVGASCVIFNVPGKKAEK